MIIIILLCAILGALFGIGSELERINPRPINYAQGEDLSWKELGGFWRCLFSALWHGLP